MNKAPVYCLVFTLAAVLVYSCKKEYSYEGGPSSSGYLIKDNNNNCSQPSVSGNYMAGKTLSDSNFIEVRVHVTRAGMYSIKTGTVNGYSFAASGNFNDTGIVVVKLQASGKSLIAGTDFFNIEYDSTNCQMAITVLTSTSPVVQTSNPDYFPLTDGSRWVYDDLTFPGDSIIRTVTGATITLNGTVHKVIDEYKSFYPSTNKHYYRKTGTDYFRYTSLSGFTSSFSYSPPLFGDIYFLKENIITGYSWYSDTWNGRTSMVWQFIDLRYHFRCLDADATVMVNGRTFAHVYKIQMIPEIADTGLSLPMAPTGEMHTLYYAKGIGLIYAEFHNGILPHPVLRIRSWAVN